MSADIRLTLASHLQLADADEAADELIPAFACDLLGIMLWLPHLMIP